MTRGPFSQWSDDGRSLYTAPIGTVPASLRRVDIASGSVELVADLEPSDPAGVVQISPVAVTPDGGAYVYGYLSGPFALALRDRKVTSE